MSYPATVFKVMIASPSDVSIERGLVRELLAEWNTINADKSSMVLLPIGWETHSTPEVGGAPQYLLNKQILKDCDLLIGIFWTRIGTPTDQYASGTVEEIEEHIKVGKPAMLYFSSAPVRPDSVDPDQYSELQKFKQSYKNKSLYSEYMDNNDFRKKLNVQLQIVINKDPYFANHMAASTPTGSAIQVNGVPIRQVPAISAEAKELLKACAEDRNGHIMFLKHLSGQLIQSNGRNFITDRNPRTLALWEGALKELRSQEFIEDVGYKGEIFKITQKGYEYYDLAIKAQ